MLQFIFIILITVTKVQSTSYDLILHEDNGRINFNEHWTAPVAFTGTLSISSAICYLHASLPNSSFSLNPNKTSFIYNLNRNNVTATLLILAGDVSLNPGPTQTPFTIPKPSEAQDDQFDCFKRRGLHFIHLNTRSLPPKISELRLLARKTSAAVIAISESWMDHSVTDSEISIEGYSALRNDRNRHGGGVCVYIKNDIAFNPRLDLHNDKNEALWFELLLPRSKPIIVGVCYRSQENTTFLSHFEETLSKIRSDCEIMVLGDFNYDYLLPVKSCAILRMYKDVLNLFSLQNLINEPTRLISNSCLDHILCNNSNKICQSGTICIGMSDHILTYCSRKVVKKQISQHNVIKIRSLKNYSPEHLLNSIFSANWSNVYCSDVNHAWETFKTIFTGILDHVAPIKEIRLKSRTEPWINNTILEDIRNRDSFLYQYKKTKDHAKYSQFSKLRNKVQRDVRKAKANYFQDQIEVNKSDSKKLWNQFKSLGYSSKTKDQSKVVLNVDGQPCFNSTTVANYINSFYTTVASSLVSKLPPSLGKFGMDSNTVQAYYDQLGVKDK